jgi:hypothetical protein
LAELPSRLRYRLARLPDDPDRAFPERDRNFAVASPAHFFEAMSLLYEGNPVVAPGAARANEFFIGETGQSPPRS